MRTHAKVALGILILGNLGLAPARAAMTQICNWGVGALTPAVYPASTQVVMMPVVLDFHGIPSGTSQVAFISFQGSSGHAGGVLRLINDTCTEIARFPDPSCPFTLPANCPANLATTPRLEPSSGLAAARLNNTSAKVDIVGVIDNNRQLIAFNLVGGCLRPKWCSPLLPASDPIAGSSVPAIAQLDSPNSTSANKNEIVIDNKVFNFNGSLRYSGHNGPRSRTVVVAPRFGAAPLPQVVVAGRGTYRSSSGLIWTGTPGWQNNQVTNSPLVYPAIAELDPNSPGAEAVVTDTLTTTLRVLSANGVQLASVAIPNPGYNNCGGPPMIGNMGFPVIGVASCSRYVLYRYIAGNGTANSGTLAQQWSTPTFDPSGQTTSTFYNTPVGNLIYYADAQNVRIFNAANGAVLQTVPNTSATALEGAVIASFTAAQPKPGRVIVVASNYQTGGVGQQGVRIFSDPWIGPTRDCWNQHTYHVANLNSCTGLIPTLEVPNWAGGFHNTYRVQQP